MGQWHHNMPHNGHVSYRHQMASLGEGLHQPGVKREGIISHNEAGHCCIGGKLQFQVRKGQGGFLQLLAYGHSGNSFIRSCTRNTYDKKQEVINKCEENYGMATLVAEVLSSSVGWAFHAHMLSHPVCQWCYGSPFDC